MGSGSDKDYYSYNDIRLKTYIAICETGDYTLLVKRGRARIGKCSEIWEEIVKTNAEANGSYEYFNYLRTRKEYFRLIAERDFLKLAFTKLLRRVDRALVAEVKQKGFNISLLNSEQYSKTLYAAIHRWNNYSTKIKLKQNEMEGFAKDNGDNVKSFEEIMGNLTSLLEFTVPDDITLARFNEYRKFIKEKYKSNRKSVA
jgi:hypothetical protein